jgi:hypothetical protein
MILQVRLSLVQVESEFGHILRKQDPRGRHEDV